MTGSLDRAIVVTGASTGIGHAAVAKAVAEGAHVFPSVRKRDDADALVRDFGDAVTPLVFDVAAETAVRAGASQVAAALGKRRLFGLVNNAGIAVAGPLLYLETEDLQRQFDINLMGVHRTTKAFLPLLGTDNQRDGKPGRIVMISSVGGKIAQPFAAPYAASKFALEGYAESLRRELMLFGVDVIIVAPGAIATPIWGKGDADAVERLSDTPYGPAMRRVYQYFMEAGKGGLPPERVGDLIWRVLNEEAPKTRYAILRRPFMDFTLPRLLPKRMLDRIVAKRLGFPSRS